MKKNTKANDELNTLKKTVEELRIAHEDLKAIIDTLPTPLLVINTDRTIKIANKIFYDKFLVKHTETEDRLITELGNGQWNIPALLNVLDKTLNERICFNDFEVEHTFPSIGNKVISLNATSVQLSGSRTNVALLSITDVTDIIRTERMLKNSEEKYRNLLSSTYDGIIVLRKDGTIEFANPKLEVMFGYDNGELLNQNYNVLVSKKDRVIQAELHGEYVLNPTQREIAKSRNVIGQRKDGSEFPISVNFSPFKSNSEMLINCTVRNISEQIKIEETRKNLQLKEKELLIEAEKNNRIKDEFLATLSHELRTPLTAILGWVQELRTASLSPSTIEKGLAVIERSAHAQEQLINDLLDISRIQSSKLSLDMQVIDLVKVLNLAIDSIQKSAEKKAIRVEKNITPVTCMVFADSIRLQQVFWNLLTNAIKFTPDNGKISISLTLVDTPFGKRVQIQFTDTGLGIKPDFLPYIFQRFSQADSSTARIYSGLGLGLAISRSLVGMQNGKIMAESKGTGQGTTFTIVLPLAAAKENPNEKIRASADQQNIPVKLVGIKVLAVDDNEDNRVLFSIILKSLGAVVQVAESAAEALKILTEFKPNVILSDISMPVEDGYSLLRKIRERETANNEVNTPVIALTAHAGDEDVKRVLAAGFSAHVAKPVEKSVLSHVIAELAKTNL